MPESAIRIDRVRRNWPDESEWLYIVGPVQELSLETEADLGCPEVDESTDEEITPIALAERGLQSTIDVQTVEDCIKSG